MCPYSFNSKRKKKPLMVTFVNLPNYWHKTHGSSIALDHESFSLLKDLRELGVYIFLNYFLEVSLAFQ